MAKVLVQDQLIAAYPATLEALNRMWPDTSFSDNWHQKDMSEWNAFDVIEVDKPEYDEDLELCIEGSPLNVDGEWYQQWITRALAEDELLARCNYLAFWDALLISPVYQKIRAQSMQSLAVNTCCTEFIAAMTDAKAGRANKDAIQACIWLLMNELTLDEADIAEMQGLLDAGKMSMAYTLQPPV